MNTTNTFTYVTKERPEAVRALAALFNEYREAARNGAAAEELSQRAAMVRQAMDDFESYGALEHTNPAWITSELRAEMESLLGTLDKAIECQRDALAAAKDDLQRAKSHSNLSEYLRRRGRAKEAVTHATAAYNITGGSNHGIVINLITALARSGALDQAEKIACELVKHVESTGDRQVLDFHVRFDDEFRSLQIASVKRLIDGL